MSGLCGPLLKLEELNTRDCCNLEVLEISGGEFHHISLLHQAQMLDLHIPELSRVKHMEIKVNTCDSRSLLCSGGSFLAKIYIEG
ncbi:hypothetical protein IMY05_012G0068700 [Salix suchowensis]|nr:hypothetical protein IMY05_012G0068700 [Salix suchowensis]